MSSQTTQRVVVIDNYDSFTYNLVQLLRCLGAQVDVLLNDTVTPRDVAVLEPDGVLISPGPGGPTDAGLCLELVSLYADRLPILGVCLGHQVIAQHYGASVVQANAPRHGKTSLIHHSGTWLYAGLPSPFRATRYNSLSVDPASLPSCLEVTARCEHGSIMGLRHALLSVEGIQFHPESVLSEQGSSLLGNWLARLSAGGQNGRKKPQLKS